MLKVNPQNMTEWLDFAWRLQLITQDHNYAGINGIQSNFDRFRYKESALQIAKDVREISLKAITSQISAEADAIVVFNSLNWQRTEAVANVPLALDGDNTYFVEDLEGMRSPLVFTDQGYTFLAQGIPSVGYKTFTVKEGRLETVVSKQVNVTATFYYDPKSILRYNN